MTLALGLLVGLTFGIASASADRRWGTVLACVPIASWFVVFGVVSSHGLRDSDVAPLCSGLFGVVVGVFVGQLLVRDASRSRR